MQREKLEAFLPYFVLAVAVLAAVVLGLRTFGSEPAAEPGPAVAQTALPAPDSGVGPTPRNLVPNPLAFPGAEGFGARTFGGRFGRVLFVTNLNDTADPTSPSYPGSLRWALTEQWADDPSLPYDQGRFIVFKVGGTINLVEPLLVSQPYTTLAAQSAPGGITLRREGLKIATHDVIIRGLRIRVGDEAGPTCCRDGVNLSTTDSRSDIYNVIIDHTSVSWAIDENFSFYVNPDGPYTLHDVTVQWSIISEGLHDSVHVDEGASSPDPHSMGMIVEEGAVNLSIHHNLFAQNWGRNPRLSGAREVEFLNNVIYAWDDKAVEVGQDGAVVRLVGNYFKLGDKSKPLEIVVAPSPASVLFLQDNLADDGQRTFAARISTDQQTLAKTDAAVTSSGIRTTDPTTAYTQVLQFAGALAPTRDEVDSRVVEDVRAGTGSIIDTPRQVGGWPAMPASEYPLDDDHDGLPSAWEAAHGLDPADAGDANSPNWLSPAGYTWLEEYLNSLIPQP